MRTNKKFLIEISKGSFYLLFLLALLSVTGLEKVAAATTTCTTTRGGCGSYCQLSGSTCTYYQKDNTCCEVRDAGQLLYSYCACRTAVVRGTCPCASCNSCCSNTCNGTCTLPSCPSGYTRTNPNNLCSSDTRTISCTYKNDCGNTCRRTATCYRIETNVKTSAPTSISLSIKDVLNGDTYNTQTLNTSSSSPTTVIMACAGTTPRAQIYVPSKTAPSTSRGLGYSYQANNEGVNGEWSAFGCTRAEDFCLSNSTTRIQDFPSSPLATQAVLKEGAKGWIEGRYYTINRCNNNVIYSDWIRGYYEVETNTVPNPGPSDNVTVKIDGKSYVLSRNISTPVSVKYPSLDNDVSTSLISQPKPATSKEIGTRFRILPGYEKQGNSFSLPFAPSIARSFLQEGSSGSVLGSYYTLNRCGENIRRSTEIEGFFTVNNEPDPKIPCPCNPEIEKSNPLCICCEYDELLLPNDSKCKEDMDCPCMPDIKANDPLCICDCPDTDPKCVYLPKHRRDVTAKGCRSTDYTGKEINNPLEIRISATDEDDIGEVRGAIVWFNKQGEAVSSKYVIEIEDSFNNASPSNIAVMIVRSGSSWENPPSLYAYRSDGKWGELGSSNAFSVGEGDQFTEITVSVDKISEGDDLITFDLSLLFDNSSSSTLNGMYDFKSLVVDRYMIFTDDSNKYKVDLSGMKTYFKWGIDLKSPTVASLNPETSGIAEISVDVNSDGTGSNVTDLVINGYKSGGSTVNSSISLTQPLGISNLIELLSEPSPDKIGVLGDSNSWWLSSLSQSPYSQEFKIDMGQNEGGTISIYATAFDQGCNDSMGRFTIDLNPWVVTKGGVIYTKDGFVSSAKNLSEAGDVEIALKTFPPTHIFTRMTTGSELISSRQDAVQELIYGNFVKAVRANRIYDTIDKKSFWFAHLSKKFEERKTEGLLTPFTTVGNSVSQNCIGTNCYMESLEEDITIPEGYKCDKNTLFISHNDIIIKPDVVVPTAVNADNIKGCIFLAKNKIRIEGGEYNSLNSNKVEYDYIEGFLIAEDQVLLELADLDKVIRDGLEVKGGIVAFGRESADSSGLLINRNLRLFNTYYPTLVVSWDVRYAKLSEIFFGTEAPMYKQEVGFKAY